jgi:hypothetical protein
MTNSDSHMAILRVLGIRHSTKEILFLTVMGSKRRTITLKMDSFVTEELGRKVGKAFAVYSKTPIDIATDKCVISLCEV